MVGPLYFWASYIWIQVSVDWKLYFDPWLGIQGYREQPLFYAILHKDLEHPQILVWKGVLEPIPHRYWGMPVKSGGEGGGVKSYMNIFKGGGSLLQLLHCSMVNCRVTLIKTKTNIAYKSIHLHSRNGMWNIGLRQQLRTRKWFGLFLSPCDHLLALKHKYTSYK